jgi:hypothetical protein
MHKIVIKIVATITVIAHSHNQPHPNYPNVIINITKITSMHRIISLLLLLLY